MNRRYPPIIAGLLGFALCIVVFWIEGTVFLYYRAKELEKASTGELVEGNDGKPQCVAYVEPSEVKKRYVNAKKDVTHPLGLPIDIGGIDVACTDDNVRVTLGKLAAASVHAIKYTYDLATADGSVSNELDHTYAAVMAAAHGWGGEANWTNVVEALRQVEKPPTTCEEIYPGATEVAIITEPRTRIEIACFDVELSSFTYDENVMYSHCLNQFYLGLYTADRDPWNWGWQTSGTGGTLGLPVYGQLTKPALTAWANPPGFNSTSPPWARARILTGIRYGYSVFGSVPVFILASFLLVDCIFFSIVELTMLERMQDNADAVDAMGGNKRTAMYAVLVVYATTKASRNERFFFTFFGWCSVILFRCIFVWAPWNHGHILPRSNCKSGSGWEEDTEANALEWLTMWFLLIVILILPISKTGLFSTNYAAAYSGGGDSEFSLNIVAGARRTRKFMAMVIAGTLIALIGQAFAAIVFGEAWAEAIVTPTQEGAVFSDADSFSEVVYTKTVGAYALSVTGGIAMASVLGRWLFGGRSFCACMALVLWLLLALSALLPVLILDGITFDRTKFNEECKEAFGTDSAKKTRCEVRFWAYVTGLITIFVPLVLMFIYCLFRNAFTVCTARSRAEANASDSAVVEVRNDLQQADLLSRGELMSGTGTHIGDNIPLLRCKTL
jgi:hypothetical protein